MRNNDFLSFCWHVAFLTYFIFELFFKLSYPSLPFQYVYHLISNDLCTHMGYVSIPCYIFCKTLHVSLSFLFAFSILGTGMHKVTYSNFFFSGREIKHFPIFHSLSPLKNSSLFKLHKLFPQMYTYQ